MEINKKRKLIILTLVAIATLGVFTSYSLYRTSLLIEEQVLGDVISNPFEYQFRSTGVLQESSTSSQSTSPYWWLNSGGYLTIKDGTGRTPQGEQPLNSKWRLLYTLSSSSDTDTGTHPQNLYRLLTKSKWKNIRQQAYFKINKYNLSNSENRNESNALLLFNRYVDNNNLYYMGLRVDGDLVIKKKIAGQYTTLISKEFIPGNYNKDTNPNLIPTNKWIGLRSEVTTNLDGNIVLKLYIDYDNTKTWKEVLSFTDTQSNKITSDGLAGIRTDFMDVEFDDYYIREYK